MLFFILSCRNVLFYRVKDFPGKILLRYFPNRSFNNNVGSFVTMNDPLITQTQLNKTKEDLNVAALDFRIFPGRDHHYFVFLITLSRKLLIHLYSQQRE